MDNNQEIIDFTESFFKNLKANVVWDSNRNLLEIKSLPLEFEEFSGKKAPYSLSFQAGFPDAEFMTKGSFLLKSMTNYLESRGQTTLIKLDFERDYKKEFEKHLKLKDCELYNLTRKIENKMIVRFTFMTTFQYINEKEQLMNSVYVRDGQVINFNLEKYKTLDGRKEEIPKSELKPDYEAAKLELRKLLEKKTQETSETLKNRLNKELDRVKGHYQHQLKELDDGIKRSKYQLTNLEKQFLSPKNDESEKAVILTKIEKIKETIKELENSDIKKKLEDEEKFFINDETHKHTLNIGNKLMNTTLIYYPEFTFTLFFRNKDSARQVDLTYKPMEDTLTPLVCEGCKREITEINLCSSGHIICQNCNGRCGSCYSSLCTHCLKKDCNFCGMKLCKKCILKCSKCLKQVCKSHIVKDYATGKDFCLNCAIQCTNCHNYTTSAHIKKTDRGDICEKCARLVVLKKED